MSNLDWSALEQAWQSAPATAAPALDVVRRQQRRALPRLLFLLSEIVIAIAGFVYGSVLVLASEPTTLVSGIFVLLVTVVACGLSLWARWVPKSRPDDAVTIALAQAIRRARIGVRMGLALLWGMFGMMAVTGAFFLFWFGQADLPARAAKGLALAAGIEFLYSAAFLSLSFLYYSARSRDLVRLQALEVALRAADG